MSLKLCVVVLVVLIDFESYPFVTVPVLLRVTLTLGQDSRSDVIVKDSKSNTTFGDLEFRSGS